MDHIPASITRRKATPHSFYGTGFNPRNEDHMKRFNQVFNSRPPQMWREALDFWLWLDSGNKAKYNAHCRTVKDRRGALTDAKFGTTETKFMRLGISFPEGFYHYLQLFDPLVFSDEGVTGKNSAYGRKKKFRKVVEAFPEFQVPERL